MVLYTRKSGGGEDLVYGWLELRELCRLSDDVWLCVLLNADYGLGELRVENLENSDCFGVAGAASLNAVINTLSTSVL